MSTRQIVAVMGLAIGLATPATAQRPTTCEGPPDACAGIVETFRQFVTAGNNKDLDGILMTFTDDAVLVGEGPVISGKEALRKNYSNGLQAGFADNVSPIDQVHVAGNMGWAIGSFSVTGPGPNNTTQKYHGNWGGVFVNESGIWKARMRTFNIIEKPD